MLVVELGLPLTGRLDASQQTNMSWFKEKAGFLYEYLTPLKKWFVTVLDHPLVFLVFWVTFFRHLPLVSILFILVIRKIHLQKSTIKIAMTCTLS
jgi:hypothetical protein